MFRMGGDAIETVLRQWGEKRKTRRLKRGGGEALGGGNV